MRHSSLWVFAYTLTRSFSCLSHFLYLLLSVSSLLVCALCVFVYVTWLWNKSSQMCHSGFITIYSYSHSRDMKGWLATLNCMPYRRAVLYVFSIDAPYTIRNWWIEGFGAFNSFVWINLVKFNILCVRCVHASPLHTTHTYVLENLTRTRLNLWIFPDTSYDLFRHKQKRYEKLSDWNSPLSVLFERQGKKQHHI